MIHPPPNKDAPSGFPGDANFESVDDSKLPLARLESSPLQEILALHGEILQAARTSLDKALRVGQLLEGIKAGLAHGAWLPWIKTSLPFSDRTARNYIRVYEGRDRLKLESVSDLTQAYRLLEDRKDGEPEKPRVRTIADLFADARRKLVPVPEGPTVSHNLHVAFAAYCALSEEQRMLFLVRQWYDDDKRRREGKQ